MLFTAAFTLLEPAKVLPLYFLLAMLNSSRPAYASTAGRPVHLSVATSMVPVTLAVYAFFVIISCVTPMRQPGKGDLLAIWRFLPICISLIIQLIASMSPAVHSPGGQLAVQKEYMLAYLNTDYPPLRTWYRLIFFLSLLETLFMSSSLYHQQRLIVTSIASHCLYNVFQMRKLSYTTTGECVSAMLKTVVVMVLVGPTAAYAGLWYWREDVIYRVSEGLV